MGRQCVCLIPESRERRPVISIQKNPRTCRGKTTGECRITKREIHHEGKILAPAAGVLPHRPLGVRKALVYQSPQKQGIVSSLNNFIWVSLKRIIVWYDGRSGLKVAPIFSSILAHHTTLSGFWLMSPMIISPPFKKQRSQFDAPENLGSLRSNSC